MANITFNVGDLSGLTKAVERFHKQIPFATANALNDTAFDLMRSEKQALAENLTLRNQWTQKGERVEKASKKNLVARVGNIRWYMETLVEGGVRTAQDGIIFNGERWLLIPTPEMRNSRGGLKRYRVRKNGKAFIIESGSDTLLVFRLTKKSHPLQVVGRLVKHTHYQKDTYPHGSVVNGFNVEKEFGANWIKRMEQAIKTAR